jgi:hypothetical protein
MLRAKRCLAFQHCAREAVEYYQTPSDKFVEGVNGPKDKGYCASYDEAYCAYNAVARTALPIAVELPPHRRS